MSNAPAEHKRPLLTGFQRILATLMPREEDFFTLFQEMSDVALQAAETLKSVTDDMSRLPYAAEKSDELEHQGDDLVHQITDRLNSTFVTPVLMDRADILTLAEHLDNITDHVKAVIDRCRAYEIEVATDHARRMADLLLRAAQLLRDNLHALKSLRPGCTHYCANINELENQGDVVLRAALGALFRQEQDARNIIKWKDIYEMMEEGLDHCEDAANLVEAMVVKNA